jgi:predicted RNA binding protein YcfA (HicA-like mRNA interferase family)
MNSRELIRLIEADGWKLLRVTGSHHHFKHTIKPGIVTIPHPKRDLPIGTVKSVKRQAQIN